MPVMVGVLLAVLGLGGEAAPGQERGLVGRWDLVFREGDRTFPGWLEVTRDGDSLAGRLQGRVGHAMPVVSVTLRGSAFQLRWLNEYDPSGPVEVEGTVAEGGLRGTMTSRSGQRWPFTGVRAPALPAPARVEWGEPIDLLARGLEGWTVREGQGPNGWTFAGGELVNTPPSADLISRGRYTNFRLRLEFNLPPGGNSGIYLRGRHEVQVQDDYGKEPHPRRLGGIYGQVTPTSVPARPAGEWQVYEITLLGRRVHVVLNGVTIIDGVEIPGITGGALDSDEAAPGPIMLQGDHTGVRYRNIVLTPARDPR